MLGPATLPVKIQISAISVVVFSTFKKGNGKTLPGVVKGWIRTHYGLGLTIVSG